MTEYLLAIDAGTSAVRCFIFDFKGVLISSARHDWSYQSPAEIAPLGREFNPDEFWKIICHTIKQAIKRGDLDTGRIRSVSATSQREGAVFLDKAGRELYGGPNIDLRALAEGMAIDDKYGKKIYAITGHVPAFMFVPAKLKWFEANHPETFGRISTVLSIGDWIVYRLCGERVSEACNMAEMGLLDINTRQYSGKLRSLLSLPQGIYPGLVPVGTKIGNVSREGAAETGLSQSTIAATGCPDAQCGLVGMGLKDAGQVGIISGWSTPVQMVLDKPFFDTKGRTWSGCHPLKNRWVLESSTGDTGRAYSWLKDTLFGADSANGQAYDIMDKLALEAIPGSEGVLAFIGPTMMNMSRVGLKYGGFLFPVPTSATNIGRPQLIRGSIENLSYAIKANCRQLETVSGRNIGTVAVGGGMLKSRCFTQLLPVVLGIPVAITSTSEVSGLGAAICAAVGSGTYSSLEEAMAAMASPMRLVEPEASAVLEYSDYYHAWESAARFLEKLGEELK